MRYHKIITEALMRPSQALIVRHEAMRFLAPRYGMLYRGMAISKEQEDALQRNEAILIDMPRLASWTKNRQVAEDYAVSADDALVVIGKRNLKPVLDIKRFLRFFPDDRDEGDPNVPADYRRDAAREAEVVVEHDGPLMVGPTEAKIL